MLRAWCIDGTELERTEPALLNFASQKHDGFFIVVCLLTQCRQLGIPLGLRVPSAGALPKRGLLLARAQPPGWLTVRRVPWRAPQH
jgi:hypothetical protein